jgi:hypothetical protein
MAPWGIVVGLLVVVAPAAAQLRYMDNQGNVHWVQTPEHIPPEYREKAEQPKLPEIDAGKGEDQTARARRKAFEAETASSARFQRAVEKCRQKTDVEAFVNPGDSVVTLGKTQQNFDFKRCMTESGVPTDTVR